MENYEEIRLPWSDWKIVKYLGGGAYGKVYEIERTIPGIQEKAALKIISRPKDDEEIESYYSNGYDEASIAKSYEQEIQNYVQEYKVMRELQGQSNIVSCDDFTIVPRENGIGGDIFIRMELLTSLQQVLKKRLLSVEEIIRLGKDISRALIMCERKHIIHRDIKPVNIMISQFGDFKLGDFGVSKVIDHATYATATGTPEYQAPEVVHMEKYGQTADIYSLGITLYWLLNNRRMPFIGADEQLTPMKKAEAMERRYRGEKLPAPKNGSDKLKKIVLKACEYRPENRYASAEELYDDLDSLERGKRMNGNTLKGANVTQEDDSKTQDNEWQESETIGKTAPKYEGDIEGKTAGNSWGGSSETIGKPGENYKKSGIEHSGFQKSTVKNGFKVTVQNDFETGKRAQEEIVSETIGVKNANAKKKTSENMKREGTLFGDGSTAKDRLNDKREKEKAEKEKEAEQLLAQIEVEKLTAKNVGLMLILIVIAGGIGIATLSIGIGVIGCGLALYWLLFRIGNGDFDDWIKKNKEKINNIDEYIKSDSEFARRLYYEKCPNKYMLEYMKKLNPDVVKEIKNSKK